MNPAAAPTAMTGDEIVASRKRTRSSSGRRSRKVDPIPVAGAKGCWFWTPEGKRYLDFNSQLMCVNIGHGDERVIRAIQEQAATLAYANPFMATEPRARLGREARRDRAGRHRRLLLHQRRRRGQRERDQDRAAVHRPPQDPGALPLVPRRHGRRDDADRRSAPLGRRARHARRRPRARIRITASSAAGTTSDVALANLEETIQLEGPKTIAAFFLEPVTGTNGILVPPDGYLQGIRELCTKYGILMVADEVMSGFGRTGEWFAVDHWNVVPDLLTMAKGLTSAYVPLGAVGMRRAIADHFKDKVFYGGLTYNSHPLGCATALATLQVYEDDDLIARTQRGWAR